jgi:hypothetical protein
MEIPSFLYPLYDEMKKAAEFRSQCESYLLFLDELVVQPDDQDCTENADDAGTDDIGCVDADQSADQSADKGTDYTENQIHDQIGAIVSENGIGTPAGDQTYNNCVNETHDFILLIAI